MQFVNNYGEQGLAKGELRRRL